MTCKVEVSQKIRQMLALSAEVKLFDMCCVQVLMFVAVTRMARCVSGMYLVHACGCCTNWILLHCLELILYHTTVQVLPISRMTGRHSER